MLLRPVLAVSLLCGATRPVFADGVFSYDHDKVVAFFTEVLVLFAIVLLVVILLVRWLRAAARREEAKATEPALPAARTVRDRNKS
jgi:heme/copper-type cytochrome/quinol oxidase subunit 2